MGAFQFWRKVKPIRLTRTELPAFVSSTPSPASSLIIEAPVRSGQLVVCPDGDVTVVASVASGAEIVAAGSVHIYGTLRGRVLAGAYGNKRARIFCRRLEAELIAIDGHYIVADEIETRLRQVPVRAWLDGDALKITTYGLIERSIQNGPGIGRDIWKGWGW